MKLSVYFFGNADADAFTLLKLEKVVLDFVQD